MASVSNLDTWHANLGHRAYDRAAIKFRGIDADINFDLEDYEEDLKQVCEKLTPLVALNLPEFIFLC